MSGFDDNFTPNVATIPLPSPARSSRIHFVIIHHTADTIDRAKEVLAGHNAKVSSHYLIDTNGDIYALVPESEKAWHAGVSFWNHHYDLNTCSIGIEIVNLDGNIHSYPAPQIDAVMRLCLDIKQRHFVAQRDFIAHSDIAPTRKIDPGLLFPWKQLYQSGIGMWYDDSSARSNLNSDDLQKEVAKCLTTIGYDMSDQGAALSAFRRHFNAADIAKSACTSTDLAIAKSLIAKWYSAA